jgi:hypothetical protein
MFVQAELALKNFLHAEPAQIYRVAAINPEFFSSFFQMAQHS